MKKKKILYISFFIILFTAAFLYGFSYVSDAVGVARVPIICYHHLDPMGDGSNNAVITPEKFREDIISLKEAGFTGIFFQDLIDYTEKGIPLPEKPVIITFDDGYYSNYQYAYPILRELNTKATIFIIGRSAGKSISDATGNPVIPHFSLDEAREMYLSGLVDIQSHSYDMHGEGGEYPPYRRGILKNENETESDYRAALIDDCNKEKELIEKNVGNKVIAFSYPYGVSSHSSERILKELGYKVTVILGEGVKPINKSEGSLFKLKRIVSSDSISSEALIKKISK